MSRWRCKSESSFFRVEIYIKNYQACTVVRWIPQFLWLKNPLMLFISFLSEMRIVTLPHTNPHVYTFTLTSFYYLLLTLFLCDSTLLSFFLLSGKVVCQRFLVKREKYVCIYGITKVTVYTEWEFSVASVSLHISTKGHACTSSSSNSNNNKHQPKHI